jgi:hypothetical protein
LHLTIHDEGDGLNLCEQLSQGYDCTYCHELPSICCYGDFLAFPVVYCYVIQFVKLFTFFKKGNLVHLWAESTRRILHHLLVLSALWDLQVTQTLESTPSFHNFSAASFAPAA